MPTRLAMPASDPTPLFELFRGNHATELLAAAVSHLGLFPRLAAGARGERELGDELGLRTRPAAVLFTALRAMGLLVRAADGRLALSALAREHLLPGGPFAIDGYIGLAADSAGVLAMVERLRSDTPAGGRPEEAGVAFIYREGLESAMEQDASARRLTLALAGRARNVAPVLADRLPLDGARVLLDVGGGTGLYSIAFLQRNPGLTAIVWDRPEVLKVATELAVEHGVDGRLRCVPGDMFVDPPPAADVVLLSNILHDWDVPECRTLVGRCAAALPAGGRLLVHDVFLDDDLGGPLPIALYSAALFSGTQGRAYSAGEYRAWLEEAGLACAPVIDTLVHCGALVGTRP